MTVYNKTTNFAVKDGLLSGDSNKIVRGSEINTEFTNIETALDSLALTTATNGADMIGYSPDMTGGNGTISKKVKQRISVDAGFPAGFNPAISDTLTHFTSAFARATAQGGGDVWLDSPVYLTTDKISIPTGVHLRGHGAGQYPVGAFATDPDFVNLAKTRIVADAAFPASTPLVEMRTPNDALYSNHACGIHGIFLDCANEADFGFDHVSVKHSEIEDIVVFRAIVRGILEDCLVSAITGTAQAGTATTITLQTNASTRDSLYNNQDVTITAGTGVGQTRTFSDYVGSTQVGTVSVAWTTTPDATSVYSITGDAPTEGQAGANQFNSWDRVTVWNGQSANSAVSWIQQGNTGQNVNQNSYDLIKLVHWNGDGLQIWNADTNLVKKIDTFSLGTGVGVRLKGNEKNVTEFARGNLILFAQLAGSGTGGLISESGTATGAKNNTCLLYSSGNGAPNPVVQTGSTFWYLTDGGVSTTSDWLTWTPTVSFVTPGDLTVSYAVQVARYKRIGKTVFVEIRLQFTPTYTTASGDFLITGLPYVAGSGLGISAWGLQIHAASTGMTWGASKTMISGRVQAGASNIKLGGMGSGQAFANLTTVEMPTGTVKLLEIS